MWREKYIRITWGIFVLNALVSLSQLFFTYGHYLKHEYLLMAVSIFFCLFNGYFAYQQIVNVKKMKQEYKEYVWRTLSTPSEILR